MEDCPTNILCLIFEHCNSIALLGSPDFLLAASNIPIQPASFSAPSMDSLRSYHHALGVQLGYCICNSFHSSLLLVSLLGWSWLSSANLSSLLLLRPRLKLNSSMKPSWASHTLRWLLHLPFPQLFGSKHESSWFQMVLLSRWRLFLIYPIP